ncbi:unnamed protein product [Blepharisma stoltei]|uniref:Hpc2-related domain-containing protein n=1 Tax=Blepharisma stoltei TaxID=1481888 RepID=A0AAU9IPJ3_9CILI|nr:unnamed protein product [Blepharisma stoltei]
MADQQTSEPAGSETSNEIKFKSPKFTLSLSKSRIFSYADLLEDYFKENDESSTPNSSNSVVPEHEFPVFMQNILERLEKYGQLAPRNDIGFHSKGRKRPKINDQSPGEEEDAMIDNYDLDDKFIDDEELQYESAEEDGNLDGAKESMFWVETDIKTIVNTPQKKPRKSVRRIKTKTPSKIDYQRENSVYFENLPDVVKEQINKLKSIYEQNEKSGGPKKSVPKGVNAVLNEIHSLMRSKDLDQGLLCKIISEMNKVKYKVIERAMNKISKQKEKEEGEKKYKDSYRALKEMIVKNSKNDTFSWNDELRNQLKQVLKLLEQFVAIYNEFVELYVKKNPAKLKFEEEEQKIITDLKNIANSKLDNVNLKDRIKRIVPEKISSQTSNMIKENALGLLFPKKGKLFEAINYCSEDFYSSNEDEVEPDKQES